MRHCCFADPRHVFNQQMAARQKTGNSQPDLLCFPENDAVDLIRDGIDLGVHEGGDLTEVMDLAAGSVDYKMNLHSRPGHPGQDSPS